MTSNNLRRLILVLLTSAIMQLFATYALASDNGFYLGVSTGLFIPSDSNVTNKAGNASATVTFDPGFVVSTVGGYAFKNGLRVEGEFSYRRAELDKGKVAGVGEWKIDCPVWAYSGLANVYYDIKTDTPITPYLGGGIGFSNVNVGKASYNGTTIWLADDDSVFAYQVGAGFGYNINKNAVIDLGYRYFSTSDVKFELSDADFKSHNITVGIRYKF